jgi:hypothetical protein
LLCAYMKKPAAGLLVLIGGNRGGHGQGQGLR